MQRKYEVGSMPQRRYRCLSEVCLALSPELITAALSARPSDGITRPISWLKIFLCVRYPFLVLAAAN